MPSFNSPSLTPPRHTHRFQRRRMINGLVLPWLAYRMTTVHTRGRSYAHTTTAKLSCFFCVCLWNNEVFLFCMALVPGIHVLNRKTAICVISAEDLNFSSMESECFRVGRVVLDGGREKV